MKQVWINNIEVEVDNDTVFGFNKIWYDIKNCEYRKFDNTNSFSIPKTDKNLKIFDFADSLQSISTNIYTSLLCTAYFNNDFIFKDAYVYIEKIDNKRIYLFIHSAPDIFQLLGDLSWIELERFFINWLVNEKGYNNELNPFTGTFQEFIELFNQNASYNDVKIGHSLSNLYAGNYINDIDTLLTNEITSSGSGISEKRFVKRGCAFYAKIQSIFEFFEYQYEVNFGAVNITIDGSPSMSSLWATAYRDYINTKYICIDYSTGFYLTTDPLLVEINGKGFYPHIDIMYCENKTALDFVKAFFKRWQVIVSDLGNKNYFLFRFEDYKEADINVIDFSGGFNMSSLIYKPYIDDMAIYNKVIYSQVFPDGAYDTLSFNIKVGNFNKEYQKDLFKIESYICSSVLNSNDDSIANISDKEAFKTFNFFYYNDAETTNTIEVKFLFKNTTYSCNVILPLFKLLDISLNYNFLNTILEFPKYFEIEKVIDYETFRKIKPYYLYYIKELGGTFFMNKVEGFNPENLNIPAKLELIHVNYKLPHGH